MNHDMLMARVARKVHDKHVLILIRGYLNAGVMENEVCSQWVKARGTAINKRSFQWITPKGLVDFMNFYWLYLLILYSFLYSSTILNHQYLRMFKFACREMINAVGKCATIESQ